MLSVRLYQKPHKPTLSTLAASTYKVSKVPAKTRALCNWATNGLNPDAREEAFSRVGCR